MSWLRDWMGIGPARALWIPIALALLLTGCAETVAKLAVDASYLHDTASNYVREVHSFRQFIRAECKASLVREIDQVRQERDEAALREVLRRHYPGLVSVDLFMNLRDDPNSILADALGCGIKPLGVEPTE